MKIQQLLSKTPGQLKEYCEALSEKDKQDLYKRATDEAKGKTLKELRQLSKLATVIEQTMNKKLLEPFYNDDNPFNGVVILEFLGKLGRRLVLIMHSSTDKGLKELNELDRLLTGMYEELKPRLTGYMKGYVEKELRSSNFLRDNLNTFVLLERTKHGSTEEKKSAVIELIGLFALQPELNYKADVLILSIILENIKVFGDKPELSDLIDLLDKGIERLEVLEREIEMLAEEDRVNIAKCRSKIEEIEKELKDTREKAKGQLSGLESLLI